MTWSMAPLAAEDAAPSGHSSAGRILVAEDNANNRRIIGMVLDLVGADVTYAENGEEAVAAFEREPFDVILMDCSMPEMDGYEATRRLRSEGNRVPIIAVTAGAMASERDACLAAGMDDFVPKPYRPEELQRVIEHWVCASAPVL